MCVPPLLINIHSQRGGAMWITCFLCLIMGCVAGCCLIPFCMKRLRNIQHVCPECHANIHTHKPL
uniref:LITAF domain-containing protein n=1 Tax=Nothobranchius furzeri TaxID=105023 RepID=A0A8C6VVF4_NOTFU